MSVQMIQRRLASYQINSRQAEEHALKEITQELILFGLYNAGFFKYASFQGGTCLRVFHGLPRFSEDLDFALHHPNPDFEVQTFLNTVCDELKAFSYDFEIQDRSRLERVVQAAFLKDDSWGRVLELQYPKRDGPAKSLKIRIEVDTNPPDGAKSEGLVHDFPIFFSVSAHDLPSLFAGKCHALLARPYTKGRDWFDFLWYTGRRITPNLTLLQNALKQMGPWAGKGPHVNLDWFRNAMGRRIETVHWQKAKKDVEPFLPANYQKTLDLWDEALFKKALDVIC